MKAQCEGRLTADFRFVITEGCIGRGVISPWLAITANSRSSFGLTVIEKSRPCYENAS